MTGKADNLFESKDGKRSTGNMASPNELNGPKDYNKNIAELRRIFAIRNSAGNGKNIIEKTT